jgi:hypothetical protein
VLCLNVTAGIGDLDGQPDAAGRVRRQAARVWLTGRRRSRAQKAAIAAAPGLVGPDQPVQQPRPPLLGVAVGQDRPQGTYFTFFVLGIVLYCLLPSWGHLGMAAGCSWPRLRHPQHVRRRLRHMPAYLADLFGTQMVGAIHGRLLTAWSAAGVIGSIPDCCIARRRSMPAWPRTWSTTARCTSWRSAAAGPDLQLRW